MVDLGPASTKGVDLGPASSTKWVDLGPASTKWFILAQLR